jgi:hypothetical protein
MSEIKLGQEAERGPPGPTGPPGPQGATGDLSSLQKGLTALAKFHVLSKHFEEFKKLAEKFETAANDELANMRQQRHVPVGRWGHNRPAKQPDN